MPHAIDTLASLRLRTQLLIEHFEREMQAISAEAKAASPEHFDAGEFDPKPWVADMLASFIPVLIAAERDEQEQEELRDLRLYGSDRDQHWTHTTSNGTRAA